MTGPQSLTSVLQLLPRQFLALLRRTEGTYVLSACSKRTAVLVVHEPRTPLFDVNGVEAPALNPPVYQQVRDTFHLCGLK